MVLIYSSLPFECFFRKLDVGTTYIIYFFKILRHCKCDYSYVSKYSILGGVFCFVFFFPYGYCEILSSEGEIISSGDL